jgi:branched-chain amino acid transport system permease protein
VGGAGSFAGPFIGAAVAVLLPEWLRFAQSYYLLIYALLVIVMMAFCPTGIVGLVKRLFAPRRRRAAPTQDVQALALKEAKP